MTARPRRQRTPASSEFPKVKIPDHVLTAARSAEAEESFAGVDVIENYLREVHGPTPDIRDRDRWLRWLEAVEERALSFLRDGALCNRKEEARV